MLGGKSTTCSGGGSSAKNPVHTYKAAGTYVVQLTVKGKFNVDTTAKFVTVPAVEEPPEGD